MWVRDMSRDQFDVRTAFVFPGQGSQEPGMARSFYAENEQARAVFEEMDGAVDFELLDLCFGGDVEELRRTKNTQPAVFAAGVAAYTAVYDRIARLPQFMSGHSLGQYTAITAAGGLDPETGVGLVRTRGEVMEDVCDGIHGRMVAVLLVSPDEVATACERHTEVSVAGFNGPKQTVISGTATAVDEVIETIRESVNGPCRFIDLSVGEAFHSPVMQPAEEMFAAELESCPLADELHTPVVSDTTGHVSTDPDELFAALETQITNPVDWTEVIHTLEAAGVQQYVEFPPSGALTDLITTIQPDARVVTLDSIADIDDIEV